MHIFSAKMLRPKGSYGFSSLAQKVCLLGGDEEDLCEEDMYVCEMYEFVGFVEMQQVCIICSACLLHLV